MTTLADISLRIIKGVADVLQSSSTSGSATTLLDSAKLKQAAEFWDSGPLWILSGVHSGKVIEVSSYVPSTLTFATLGSSPHPCRYAVARRHYPWAELIKAVNKAFDDEKAQVTLKNVALTGDGSTLVFTLPAGVNNIQDVWMLDNTTTPAERTPDFHWEEINGELVFDTGYAPVNGDTIEIDYRGHHTEVTTYTDVIDNEIDLDWLEAKATEFLMEWAIHEYGNNPQKMYAQWLQNARDKLVNLRPLRLRRRVRIKTA